MTRGMTATRDGTIPNGGGKNCWASTYVKVRAKQRQEEEEEEKFTVNTIQN